jgi:hypothetical protein
VRNDGIVGDKAVSAGRRLECDAQASFCYDRVEVASNWMPYLADARGVSASFPPKRRPAKLCTAKPTRQTIVRSIQKNGLDAGVISTTTVEIIRVCRSDDRDAFSGPEAFQKSQRRAEQTWRS